MKFYIVTLTKGNNTFPHQTTGFICSHVPQFNDFDFLGELNGARHLPEVFAYVGDVLENPERFFRVLRKNFGREEEKAMLEEYRQWEGVVTNRLQSVRKHASR